MISNAGNALDSGRTGEGGGGQHPAITGHWWKAGLEQVSMLDLQPEIDFRAQCKLTISEACFVAALHASDAAVRNILAANAARSGLPADDTEEFHEATRQFRLSIVNASENSLFVSLIESLWEQKNSSLWVHWYNGTKSRENRLASVAHGQEIANAIEPRRAEAARTAMHHHIDWLVLRFLSY